MENRHRASPAPTFIDLFAGAGGLSLGLAEAGFKQVLAVDHYKPAVETHFANIGDDIRREEISSNTDLPSADLIVGGPPCQGFSSAGRRTNGDERNSLVRVFANLVARAQPRAFVFENVEGFLTAEKGQRVLDLLEPLVDSGYHIHLRKINAANFGVPQHRKRVIAIGGLGWTPTFPEPSHFAFGAPGAERVHQDLPPCPSILEALAGLPDPDDSPPGEPNGHYGGVPSDADLERITRLRPGQTMRDLPPELRHDSYSRRANRRVADGTPTAKRGGAPAGLRRLSGHEPSKTITSGAKTEFIHPCEDRYLTLRECARLQTFPDEFAFCGNVSQQMLLIGNAVPPRLGAAIGRSLFSDLLSEQRQQKAPGLKSFVVTHASAMSPALRHTVDLVTERFPSPLHPQAMDLFGYEPRSEHTVKEQKPKYSMSLTKEQKQALTKLRTNGGSTLGVGLDNERLFYLLSVVARDLGVSDHFPELPDSVPELYDRVSSDTLVVTDVDSFQPLYERLLEIEPEASTYFFCLGSLLKARLKYERILEAQPIPTVEQVGPRALLQLGSLSMEALASLLFWRKWIYDIDNRAAQETGYLFEPILAQAMGGVPFGAGRSPVKRGGTGSGRQVDCIVEEDERKRAYELKLRVTIAASGQGRWGEELAFPEDCKASGFTPVLVVFDETPNPKLEELSNKFVAEGGESYVGSEAWTHLEEQAGDVMSRFIEEYVRAPIAELLEEASEDLPPITFSFSDGKLIVETAGDRLEIDRVSSDDPLAAELVDDEDDLPDDVDEQTASPNL